MEEPRHTCQTSNHDQGWVPQGGWDHSQMWWDLWAALPLSPSPSPDHGFKSDRSSVSTSSSMSLRSDRSGGPRHTHHSQCYREPGGHMKINLSVFKDKETKDTITYQIFVLGLNGVLPSWVPRLHPSPLCYPLPTGLPWELVRSLGTDVTLDVYWPYWMTITTMLRP